MAGLSRLRQAAADLEPSAGVEQELRRAFRREISSSPSTVAAMSWSWQRWGAVAAGIILVLAAGIQLGTRLNAPAEPELVQVENQTPEAAGEMQVAVGSDFIPIGGCLEPECLGNSQLMRVRIPRSSLLHFGLPMNLELAESEVLADVLVAEDGSAQAIRFVNY